MPLKNLLLRAAKWRSAASLFFVASTFIFGNTVESFGQNEQLGLGGANREDCRRAAVVSDSMLLTVGFTRTYGPGTQNGYVALSNVNGNAESGYFYNSGSGISERFNGIAPLSSGNFLLIGNAVNGTNGYLSLGKINNDTLAFAWGRQVIPSTRVSLWNGTEMPDGRVAFVGWYVHSTDDLLFGLIDTLGNLDWMTTFDRSGNEDRGFAINPSIDGGSIYSVGKTEALAGDFQGYLARIDTTDGSLIWAQDFGGTSDEYLFAVNNTLDSNIITAGYTESFGAGGRDILLTKLDTNGNILWSKAIGSPDFENCSDLIVMDDGGFLLAGVVNQTGGNFDYLLLRTDADGNFQWAKTYGSNAGDDRLSSLSRASQNRFILSGHSNSFGSDNEHYMVYVDSMGRGTCVYDSIVFSTSDLTLTTSTGYSFEGDVTINPWSPSIDTGMVQFDPCDILTLPVQMLSHELDCENEHVTIRWSTISELNNMEFRVYRYESVNDYTLVGIVEGAGNSSNQLFYELDDPNRSNPGTIYKIVQVDYDGKMIEYSPLSVKNCHSTFTEPTLIYENNGIRIILPENNFTTARSLDCSIVDMKGAIIHSESILIQPNHDNYFMRFDTSISSGIYMSSMRVISDTDQEKWFFNKIRID